MIRRLLQRPLKRNGEEGMALVMVISIGAVLTIIIATAVTYALGGFRKANVDEAWSAAMSAAYAGVEEYQSRLANDPTYVKYGNASSIFTAGSGSAVIAPAEANPAFGIGAAGTWATVPRPTTPAVANDPAQYRYEIDNSKYSTSGTIRLRSTGKAGDQTRTIVADLRQQGFIDFLYFTNYEISDPAFTGVNSGCVKHKWAGRPTSDSTGKPCGEIQFGTNDVIAGPVHSNDTIRVCASRFKDSFTTSNNPATGLKYTSVSGCSAATFDLAASGFPAYSKPLLMPASNGALIQETRSDLAAENGTTAGCLFTGPTSIRFLDNGTMTVRSPYTKATNVVGAPATSGTAPARCGTPGATGLGSATGQNINVPANNVIFVQSVPTTAAASTNPNAWAASGASSRPAGFNCVGLPTSGSNPTTPTGNGIGYPTTNEVAASTSYGCRSGDVFVSGKLDGNVTIGADNYIYVTGQLTYEDSNDDMLGLIGNNAVIVWNPVNGANDKLLSDTGRRIDAAILSVNHTFTVQNYDNNDYRGVLTINGAIAQNFRGPVGLANNSSGYSKLYEYDKRLKYTAPPKFLSPVSTTYGVNTWVETNVAFAADGSPK